MKLRLALALLLTAFLADPQTRTQQKTGITATGDSTDLANLVTNSPAIGWRLNVNFTGASCTSAIVQLDCAPDNGSGGPGSYGVCTGNVDGTNNPVTLNAGSFQAGTIALKLFTPHIAINPISLVGTGCVLNWNLTGLFGASVLPTTVTNGGGGGGGGGSSLLFSSTASGIANLVATTRNAAGTSGNLFQSDFQDYDIRLVGFQPATDAANLTLQFSANAGSSWITTGYQWSYWFTGSGSGSGAVNNNSDTAVHLSNANSNNANASVSVAGTVWNPLGTGFAQLRFDASQVNSGDSNFYKYTGSGAHGAAGAVNALRVQFDSGNIAAGQLQVYGLAH